MDFSYGISYPGAEATVKSKSLTHFLTRNKNARTALHELIFFSKEGSNPVQLKASFDIPTYDAISAQLKICRNSEKKVNLLIWISLADVPDICRKRHQFRDSVAFLNGSGICNGMSLDILRSAKLVKRLDNATH